MVLLQHNDIVGIFPRIKDRVKFVDLRAKLIADLNDQHVNTDRITTNSLDIQSSSQCPAQLEKDDMPNSSVLNQNKENSLDPSTDLNSSSNSQLADEDVHVKSRLPQDYEGPELTARIKRYIEDNDISKFNPHTMLRSELLSLLFEDVTSLHNLL